MHPFLLAQKDYLCGPVGMLEETYFSERRQDEGRQGSIFSECVRKAHASSDFATDPASVDADYDNGAAVHGARVYRRGNDRATHRVVALRPARRRRRERVLPPSGGPTQVRKTSQLMFRVRLDPDGVATVRLIA
jgi:hypothetical protein